jgi:hypothetical protein
VIDHVIPAVAVRRHVERLEPDRVSSDRPDVIQPPVYAGQIAEPITVGIKKRGWLQLIDHPAVESTVHNHPQSPL